MIDLLKVTSPRRILLVGEGNFSFTVALLNRIHRSADETVISQLQVISTCFQEYKDLSTTTKSNAQIVNELGADVYFGVDATKLHCHDKIKDIKFDCIIFNFPHIGGKMKIHLNRLLLKNFFKSSSTLLSKDGRVLVTLAQGQGGTSFDVVKRKKEDTWQITTMASYGDLILDQFSYFTPEHYPEYTCNGYRSLEKKFNCHGAITFAFSQAPLTIKTPPLTLNFEKTCPPAVHCAHVQQQSERIISTGSFAEVEPCSNYFRKTYYDSLTTFDGVQTICMCQRVSDIDWRSDVLEEINYLLSDKSCNLRSVLLCRKCCDSPNADPVQRIVSMCLPMSDSVQLLLRFISSLCGHSGDTSEACLRQGVSRHYENVEEKLLVASVQDTSDSSNDVIIALYIDAFLLLCASYPFSASSAFQQFQCFLPPKISLCPPAFSHHLSLWVQPSFSHKQFACVLRFVCGNLLRRFRLIEEYQCNLSRRTSVCYELVYQSCFEALTSEQAFSFQLSTLGSLLERCFNATVR